MKKNLIITILLAFAFQHLAAQTVWTSISSGSWSSASTWQRTGTDGGTASVPPATLGNNQRVVITGGFTVTQSVSDIILDGTARLTIQNGAKLNMSDARTFTQKSINNVFSINDGTYENNSVGNGGNLLIEGGAINWTNASVFISGNLDFMKFNVCSLNNVCLRVKQNTLINEVGILGQVANFTDVTLLTGISNTGNFGIKSSHFNVSNWRIKVGSTSGSAEFENSTITGTITSLYGNDGINITSLSGSPNLSVYCADQISPNLSSFTGTRTSNCSTATAVTCSGIISSILAPTVAPSGPASATVTPINNDSLNITGSFTNKGNGAGRIILLRPCEAPVNNPVNGVVYQKYIFSGIGFQTTSDNWVGGFGGSLVIDFADVQGFNFTFPNMPEQFAFDVFEYNGNVAAGTAVYNTTPLSFCANASSPAAPTIGATSLSFSAVGQSSLTLGWTNGNGTSRLVIARKSSEISSNPINNTTYSANPVFGNGTALGGGFVVYNGSGSAVNVTGLDPASTYYFTVIEYLTGSGTITYANNLRTTSSTNTTSSSSSSDSDEDGVSDADDEFPTDPFMASSISNPAAGFGTLMFEDLWPGKGDYDFNDLVLDYRYTVIINGAGNVVEAKYTFVTRAIGGGLQNGFAFQLDGIPANRIHSVSGAKTSGISYASIGANGAESNQTNANILVLKNASELLARSSGFAFFNVEAEAPKVEADTTVVIVKLLHEGVSPVETFTAIADFSPTIFNPYLIVGQERGKEVHLANRVPSALANVTYFGTEDDNSAPLQGRYYKTSNELPWALNIVQSVPHVIEKVDFTEAYLKFVDWAISGGVNHADWYLNLPGNRNTAKIYNK